MTNKMFVLESLTVKARFPTTKKEEVSIMSELSLDVQQSTITREQVLVENT